MFENPEVVSAWISGGLNVVAAVIAAFAAALVGRTFVRQEKLKAKFNEALADIAFLTEVEQTHCARNKVEMGESYKNRVRESVRARGYVWSGNYTKGRAKEHSLNGKK
tara:strand:- start:136 stop:459 length:324 start_codon:yes stop_codon:yes gene_type:complete